MFLFHCHLVRLLLVINHVLIFLFLISAVSQCRWWPFTDRVVLPLHQLLLHVFFGCLLRYDHICQVTQVLSILPVNVVAVVSSFVVGSRRRGRRYGRCRGCLSFLQLLLRMSVEIVEKQWHVSFMFTSQVVQDWIFFVNLNFDLSKFGGLMLRCMA